MFPVCRYPFSVFREIAESIYKGQLNFLIKNENRADN